MTVRYGSVRYGSVRLGTVRCGTVRYGDASGINSIEILYFQKSFLVTVSNGYVTVLDG